VSVPCRVPEGECRREERGADSLPSRSEGDAPDLHHHHAPSPPSWGPAAADLDAFLTRVYRYYEEGGLAALVAARVANLAALAFSAAFCAFLLLVVRWTALSSPCLRDDTCDLADVALDWRPFARGGGRSAAFKAAAGLYLATAAAYWCVAAAAAVVDVVGAVGVAGALRDRVGVSDAALATAPWSALAARLVAAQSHVPLLPNGAILDEEGIAARIMRRDNFLIGLLGAGALPLAPPLPLLRTRPALTASLEWNLRACVLDPAFGGGGDALAPGFAGDPAALAARFRAAALANALAAPFILVFLVALFFMRHAERFYHHPSSAGARDWARGAAWRLREFNELPHYLHSRLADASPAASRYVASFRSPLASTAARLVAFVAGSAVAALLLVALVEDRLLERSLYGRHLVWYIATLGILLTACRGVAGDGARPPAARPDPNVALLAVAAHTHHLPRHWRGRGHTREVAAEFGGLFRYRAAMFLDELLSVVATPALLAWSLPAAAPGICAFFGDHTARVDGVGDVCSLSVFRAARAGAGGAGKRADRALLGGRRSRHGKLEASLLAFAGDYPSWAPDADARRLLAAVAARAAAGGVPGLPPGPAAASLAGSLLRAGGAGGGGWAETAFASAEVVPGPSTGGDAAAACQLALLAMAADADAGESGGDGDTADGGGARPRPDTARCSGGLSTAAADPAFGRSSASPPAEHELASLGGAAGAPRSPRPPPPRSLPPSALTAGLAAASRPPLPAFDAAGAWDGGPDGGCGEWGAAPARRSPRGASPALLGGLDEPSLDVAADPWADEEEGGAGGWAGQHSPPPPLL